MVAELAAAEVVAVTEATAAVEVVMIVQETIDLERIVLLQVDLMQVEMVPQHHEVMLQEQIADLQGLQEVTSNQAVAHAVKQVVKQDALLEVVVAVAVAREDASLLNDGVRQSRPHTPLF